MIRYQGNCPWSLVAAFSWTWKKNRDLENKQAQLGLPEHKLAGAVATRWGSAYDMVTRIIEHQQAISVVLVEDRNSRHLVPSSTEFTALEALAKVLKSLSVLTDALSGT